MEQSRFPATREEFDRMANTHDSSLSPWGPYSKVAAGVTHIAHKRRGAAFTLSVFPAIYRGQSQLPTETVQSNFHPWYASGDLSVYTYRFQLEWKDRVYCDVSYIRLDERTVLVEMEAVNNTELTQQLGFHYLSFMQFPLDGDHFASWLRPHCDFEAFFVDGVHYKRLSLAQPHHQDRLTYDGKYRCEVLGSGMVSGRALGDRFGKHPGDAAEYELNCPGGKDQRLTIRAKGFGTFRLGGCAEEAVTFASGDFALYTLPLPDVSGKQVLTLTCLEGTGLILDTLAVSLGPVSFLPEEPYFIPEVREEGNHLTLRYKKDCSYGIAWCGSDHMTRQIFSSRWEKVMHHYVMDHVAAEIHDDDKAHYLDLYARPFFLAPGETRRFYAMVCKDPTAEAFRRWESLEPEAIARKVREKLPREQEGPYALSQRLMHATIMTNIVFPIYVQGEYIRHFTPGKWWDSLYTWDSGFIALGLTARDVPRALEVLNCYLTEPGNPHAAFIHHGSPVPVQAYVYKALWDQTGSKEFLASFYPRMRQYYEFLLGRTPTSATRQMKSGLINTFAYFYNSGGWDDLPPQAAVHRRDIAGTTCPAVSTVHAIVFGRILGHAAHILGLEDGEIYEKDIRELSHALQTYSWDEEAGFFSYVTHDETGQPTGILRDEHGVNLNRTLDGAEAILAGICTPDQEKRLADALMDPRRMWTDCGISTVDRTAPYYRTDGYWNGAVWMAHQWFVFLAMLALDRTDDAAKIARTALDTWKRETDATYNCYEHFVLESGRGSGWHHFGGLSAPVILWYQALTVPGTVTVPPGSFVLEQTFAPDYRQAQIRVDAAASLRGSSSLLITMAPGSYRVRVNGEAVSHRVYDQALGIRIPDGTFSRIRIEAV